MDELNVKEREKRLLHLFLTAESSEDEDDLSEKQRRKRLLQSFLSTDENESNNEQFGGMVTTRRGAARNVPTPPPPPVIRKRKAKQTSDNGPAKLQKTNLPLEQVSDEPAEVSSPEPSTSRQPTSPLPSTSADSAGEEENESNPLLAAAAADNFFEKETKISDTKEFDIFIQKKDHQRQKVNLNKFLLDLTKQCFK